VLICL